MKALPAATKENFAASFEFALRRNMRTQRPHVVSDFTSAEHTDRSSGEKDKGKAKLNLSNSEYRFDTLSGEFHSTAERLGCSARFKNVAEKFMRERKAGCIKIAYRESRRESTMWEKKRIVEADGSFKCRENLWRLSLVKANRFMSLIREDDISVCVNVSFSQCNLECNGISKSRKLDSPTYTFHDYSQIAILLPIQAT